MRIAVTGASGLVGRALCKNLAQDQCTVVALARAPAKVQGLQTAEVVPWEALSGPPPIEALEGVEAVVHLAGEPVAAGRWNKQRKKDILESRVEGTRHLVETLLSCQNGPKVLLSGSAIGYYGPRSDDSVDETSDPNSDFLGQTCQLWESEAERAAAAGIRVVLLRTGLVLAREGGALPRMLAPFQMFVGGPLGEGKQWMSWIHIADEVGAIRHILQENQIQGPINLVAPSPVTNEEFSRELARVLRRPALFRVPGFVLRLVFGEMAECLLLQGQRVLPKNLEKAGYTFRFPDLGEALENLILRSS